MKTMLMLVLAVGMLYGFGKFMAHTSTSGASALTVTETRIASAIR